MSVIVGNCSKFIIISYYIRLLVKLLFVINGTAVNAVAVTTVYVVVVASAAVTAVVAVSAATVVAISVFSLSSARRMLL